MSVVHGDPIVSRATIMEQKAGQPVRFNRVEKVRDEIVLENYGLSHKAVIGNQVPSTDRQATKNQGSNPTVAENPQLNT